MYLKSLEMHGFKSFPDKIVLDFNKGLTGVVGPNGSGKSNIGDAVRWVLGEQSSKSLRGGKMEDVIFVGTQLRKSVGFASVTLNIDNSDRSLDMENDLVSVTRKLYRNGDSEYIINGNQVRLKDIVELFMDTGLGRDGYSIIGQGRIADIVSGKSTERREIFEEAAGISKFRYKKAEAERKLAASEDNILRLTDILGELEGRVGPLKTQSEKAKKYLVLRDERKALEVSLWVAKLDEIKTTLSGLEEKVLSCTAEYEALTRELDEIDETIDTSNLGRAKCNDRIDELRELIHNTELESSEANSKIAVLENDIEHINEAIKGIEEQILKTQSSDSEFKEQINQKEAELTTLAELKSSAQRDIEATEAELSGLTVKSDEFDKSISDKGSEINSLYIKKSELTFTVESSLSNIDDNKRLIEEGKAYIENAEKLIAENNEEKREIQKAIIEAEEKISEFNNRIAGITKLNESKTKALNEARESYTKKEIRLRELRGKVNLLNDLENSMEGFANSVKQIMKAKKHGQIKGIFGSVAQLITVEGRYSTAIETALGGAMQYIIVDNEDTAKRSIRHLKETRSGRATFLPITSVKPREFKESGFESCEGFVAIASELVSADDRFSGIIKSLLGRIVIAEDIDLATLIAKKYGYRFKICTLDGQVINAGGSFTGGSVSRSTGILTRKNEIEEIKVEIAKLESETVELSKTFESLKQEVNKLRLDIEGERELLSEHTTDKVRFEGELNRLKDLGAGYEDKLNDAENQIEVFTSKITSAQESYKNAQKELKDINIQLTEKEKNLDETQSKIQSFKEGRQALSEKLSEQKIKVIELERDEQAVMLSIEQLKEAARNACDAKTRLDLRILENRALIEEKHKAIDSIRNGITSSKGIIEKYNEDIRKEQTAYRDYEAKIAKQRAYQKIKIDERENISRELERDSEKKNTFQAEFDKIISELYEVYELTRSEAIAEAKPIENNTEANRELNSIKNKMKALGSVNLEAIDEYAEVSKRYEFMKAQLGDVVKSKNELEKLIDELTENMKVIFSDSFNKINDNFKKIFVELFGGGAAELVLSDPENILESGIEIKVAPPGKVIKNLMSLSGGEQAFVAIAIYFSILKIKPSPFCILDEIEAALDDVNVTKYAQYLRNFTDKTQFILITHRRGTMEECDILYGVTMQEKGVSKLLKMEVGQQIEIE